MRTRRSILSGIGTIPILAAALILAGCPMSITNYSDPGDFARTIFRVAREGNVREWGTLLTKARRNMGRDYVERHFQKYQKLLLELEEGGLAGNLAAARFRIEGNALEFEADNRWHTFFRVEMEEGGWKINQD